MTKKSFIVLITLSAILISINANAFSFFNFHYELAERGNADSMFILATMYESGRADVKANPVEALRWYRKAAEFGNEKARQKLVRLQRNNSVITQPKLSSSGNRKSQAPLEQNELEVLLLKLQLAEEKVKVAKEKKSVEQHMLLLQEQVESLKLEVSKAHRSVAAARKQRAKLDTESMEVEDVEIGDIKKVDRKPVVLKINPKTESTQFKSNPCDGPAAQFMSTCN